MSTIRWKRPGTAWVMLACLAGSRAGADTFAWKNPPVSGAFNAAGSWQNADGNGGYPGPGDFAIFRAGTYTVTCDDASAGMTELIGTVTFQLDGNYAVGTYIQGGNPVVLRGGGTIQGGPFTIADEGSLLVDGSGLIMNGFDFGTNSVQSRLIGTNGAQIKSSGQINGPSHFLPRPRLEGGSSWHHTGALYTHRCYVSGGSVLAADEMTVIAELDGGQLQAGHLIGSGQAKNGSSIKADTASLGPWLLEGGGNSMVVSGLIDSAVGSLYADISVKAGAALTAGSIADSAWYTVDGSGSVLTVVSGITADGPQKVTILNQGQGSAGSLSRAYVSVRDPGSLFSFATLAEDSTLSIQNGGRVNGGTFRGPMSASKTAGGSVAGAGSALVLSGNLELGAFGEGALTIDSGGRVESSLGYLNGGGVGGTSGGSVYGAGSFWLTHGNLIVGDAIGAATLNLGEGGRVEVRGSAMAVGLSAGGEGRVTVDGGASASPSALDTRVTDGTGVGVGGKGSLRVFNHGRILAGDLTVGVYAGSDGTVEVVGAGTSLEVGKTLEVGRAGPGQLTIFAGGLATATNVFIGSNTGTNKLGLTGAGSTLNVAKALRVGKAGTGQLNVEQGARVVLTGTYAEPEATDVGLCEVPSVPGVVGTLVVDGAGSGLHGVNGFLNLGFTGKGVLTVSRGGEVDFSSINIGGGQNQNSTGSVTGGGSVVRASVSLGIGAPFPGPEANEMTVADGGLISSKETLAVGKTGILRLNAGSAVVGQTGEAPIPGAVLVANRGLFLLGGRVVGSVVVREGGRFLPGWSPGHATIEGDVTLATGTALEIEMSGTQAGTSYDQIEATGTVTLAGRLELVFRDGFAPADGQVFEVVHGGAVTGQFSDVSVRGLAPGFTYTLVTTGGTALRLTATRAGVATSLPALKIERLKSGDVQVSWPDYLTTWTLQQSDSLHSGAWQPVAAPGNRLIVSPPGAAGFFRLVGP